MPITVFIADDQAMVRQGFGALLAAQPDISVIGDAPDGKVAVDDVLRLRPPGVRMVLRVAGLNRHDAPARIIT
ncbi:MAG: response regulator transcription factor, partial [Aldersonia sp.]|nr:response regulator transcription factor [Aldersonia sp.]